MIKFLPLILLLQSILAMRKLQVLVILPLNSSICGSSRWERGAELLAGAERAVQVINNDTTLLHNHTLEMLVINSVSCSPKQYEGIILPQLLNATIHDNIISAVGIFCPNTANLVIRLGQNTNNKLNFSFFIGSMSPMIHKAKLPSNFYYMLDSSLAIVKAVMSFIEHQQWTRVAIITEVENNFYSQTASTFLNCLDTHENITISQYKQVSSLHLDKSFDAKVVFVSASLDMVGEVLQLARKYQWDWPTHAWIFHTHSIDDIDKHKLLKGVFLFQNSLLKNNSTISTLEHLYPDSGSYCNASNPYSSILCQSIIAASLLKNASLAKPHSGNNTVLNHFRSTEILFHSGVDLIHILDSEAVTVGQYDTQLGHFNVINDSTLLSSKIPPGRVYQLPSVFTRAVFSIEILVSFTLVTVNLILYICFRKEPEVKATSYMITMIIFLSCYILMLYLVLLASEHFYVRNTFKNAICLTRSWINFIGVPGPLILATVLVKMLRIYKIFHRNTFSRIGKCLSDPAILCYVLVLQVPNVLVLTLWSLLDPYRNMVKKALMTNSIHIRDECLSDDLVTWPLILQAYFSILAVTLTIVAIKTRKIRKKHFKDTKKVNLFVYVNILLTVFLVGFWITTRNVSNNFDAEVALHVSHTLTIFFSQCLLIVPKIYPPLCRHIQRDKPKRKLNTTTTSSNHNFLYGSKTSVSMLS